MAFNITALLNLAGFTVGLALYGLLLVMTLGRRPATPRNRHLVATALLGLTWNLGASAVYGARDFGFSSSLSLWLPISYAALGFLPAVVVDLALPRRKMRHRHFLAWAAYSLSGLAAVAHFYGAWTGAGPSPWALRALTVGYTVLLIALFALNRRQTRQQRSVWAGALLAFAVSALHLSNHQSFAADSWAWELAGHHASLPLALAILYEDYRFALADVFLKRALALLLLIVWVCGCYAIVTNWWGRSETSAPVGLWLGLWVVTALLYPSLRQASGWFVEKVMLQRPDYAALRVELAARLARYETAPEILQEVSAVLQPTLSAREVVWRDLAAPTALAESDIAPASLAHLTHREPREVAPAECLITLRPEAKAAALLFVPTVEPPHYALVIGPLAGGRRLLSDDNEFLGTVALLTARRLDALRVTHERCEQDLRQQEISKLATEAQLRALRAQLSPHFLFNALTTIGYLIQTAPENALATLYKLTDLLRSVLRTMGEFVTLGEELDIIKAYLDIEQVRFEERLRVTLDVPERLRRVRVPSLLLQPLVENAIKHGVAPSRNGGTIALEVCEETTAEQTYLVVRVSDTGIGASPQAVLQGRRQGVGLTNIEQRLQSYCGTAASFTLETAHRNGATAKLRLPLTPDGGRVAVNGSQAIGAG